jgi:hypothetical protein
MKFSTGAIVLASLVSTASAFVQPAQRAATSGRRFVVSEPTKTEEAAEEVDATPEKPTPVVVAAEPVAAAAPAAAVAAPAAAVAAPAAAVAEYSKSVLDDSSLVPGRYDTIDYSITLPFFQKPTKLDGSHAGDYGFDPMGLTETFDIFYMQECETRHARLSMLAVVGWPLSEKLAPAFMLQDGRAPSVLNGVNPISGIAILAALSVYSIFELATWKRRTAGTKLGDLHREDMKNIWTDGVAGDYNFDPAGLYSLLGNDAFGRKGMREVEITHGRYAMLGISYFAFYEALTQYPIVEDNLLFQPNALVPILGAVYFVFSNLYQFSDLRKYPIQIQKSRLGNDLDEWLERREESKSA